MNAVYGQNGRLRAKLKHAAEASRAAMASLNGAQGEAQRLMLALCEELEDAVLNEAPIAPPVSAAPASNTELF